MANSIYGRPYVMTSKGPLVVPCPPHDVLARLGDKWTIMVVSILSIAPDNRLRFSEIKHSVDGISQRMLTQTLRHLERDGLLVRHYFPEVPPRVEYELTPLGKDMLPALEGFTLWIRRNWPKIIDARKMFDAEERDIA
ncbi:winged helix-turn-helix transcriptional regulator [Asticcacaulis sp. W401b]|uniref:winged helix-turn-helix transcriptional regulator n=1 Tax=Asticcacaulis sp. W401b TaxID=3388666 RepID=UPI003970B288